MTDRSKLLALAEAVEKLSGPDRRTDAEIQLWAVNEGRMGVFDSADEWLQSAVKYGWGYKKYTASLDAAMTLATGYILLHLSDIGADGLPLCRIGDGTLAPPVGEWVGIASDLPRSVVAACLRARAQAEALA